MKEKKLGDLCDFISGLWTGKKPPYINVGVLRNTNFNKDGSLSFDDIAMLDVEIKQFKSRKLEFGDIILEKSGGGPKQPVGRVCLFDKNEGDFSLSNFTSAIRIKNRDEIYYRYLHYYLYFMYVSGETVKIQTNSTGIRNLQLALYKEFIVPVPSLATQQKIVEILDAIFAEIDRATVATEANVKNAEALFQSYLTEVFERGGEDFKSVKIGDLFKVASSKRVLKSEWKTEGVPFYRGREITALSKNGYVQNELYITKEMYKKYSDTYGVPRAGDIMITAIGTIGNTYIVREDDEFYFKDASVLWLSKEKEINEKLINYWFKSSSFYKQLDVGLGATVDTLTIGKVQSLLINLPSEFKQHEIVNKLDALSLQISLSLNSYKEKLVELINLRHSTLRQAFNGELVKE